MTAIIVYGSLLNQAQLCRATRLSSSAIPVFVKGYRRLFNQEPSWRKGDNKHRAVLNIIRSEKDDFNGLLVRVRADSDFHQLDERERGYDRIEVSYSQLESLMATPSLIESGPIYTYRGKPEKQNDDILPNASYLELCLRGAQSWGEESWGEDFYEQFLQTTYVGRLPLKAFLQENLSC
ncbi:MAG: gamma-glutamylcyclotransferase family protein [Cyanobacteria bacterium J06649_4]